MSEEIEEIRSEKRSDECLKLLQGTAKAISSGVSYERFNEIVPINTKKTHKHFQSLITETILDGIKYSFDQWQIAEKMGYLDNLAKDAPCDTVAWRPTTGTVDMSAKEERGLSLRKLSLKQKLEALYEENECLRQEILEKRNLLRKNKEELEKFSI